MKSEVLDIAARGVHIRFHVGNGRLRVWAERFEEIEPELLDVIDALDEGAVLYDIGASIGLFSLYAAIKRCCRVFAFEAEAQNYATLEFNHFLNRDRLAVPLTAINVALADAPGLGHIHTRSYGAGEHGKILDQAVTQDTKEAFVAAHVQGVIKQPLDALVSLCSLPPPNMLKIDVDGAEAAVLAGADRTLGAPTLRTIFIELSERIPGTEAETLARYGFALVAKVPVVRLSGGHYPDLYNCVFRR
jgi:FkbM family methyltransferase